LIALKEIKEVKKVKTKQEQIDKIQEMIQKMNDQIIEITKMAEPVALAINKEILSIWNQTEKHKKDKRSDKQADSKENPILDIVGDLYKSIRSLLLNTKEIVSEI